MELFIDCEFNSFEGQLLSMAIVGNDGHNFYSELEIYEEIDPWVEKHVLPMTIYGNNKDTYVDFQAKLEAYLSHYDAVHLIADWPDDITYFTRALVTGPGERISTPPLQIEIRRDLDAVSPNPHFALSDALAIQRKYYEIVGFDPS